MKQSAYTSEMKAACIEAFWKRKDIDPLHSIRDHAAASGVPYYTFRDWYRDPRYNARFSRRHEYCSSAGLRMPEEPFGLGSFVIIGREG